jgi:probable HAF family extracellular repeat protein
LALEVLESRCLLTYTITDLGTLPGDLSSAAYGINSAGQVVGESGAHAFLYDGGMLDLGSLPGSMRSGATGINDTGQVVGWSGTLYTEAHAFLYDGGTMLDLGTLPGDTFSRAHGINGKGQIVGVSHRNDGHTFHAFLWDGTMTDLGTLPGETASSASGINDAGQVVGESGLHAFLYEGGVMTPLGALPGDSFSIANAINAKGQVVGYSYPFPPNAFHAFLYQDGLMIDLGTLGGQTSFANGINAKGQVVGSSAISGTAYHAFLYDGGPMVDLNSLLPAASGWELTGAQAINDVGQIVGAGIHDGQTHAFRLTPDAAPVSSAVRDEATFVATLVSASHGSLTGLAPDSSAGFPTTRPPQGVPLSETENRMVPPPAANPPLGPWPRASGRSAVDLFCADGTGGLVPDALASDLALAGAAR